MRSIVRCTGSGRKKAGARITVGARVLPGAVIADPGGEDVRLRTTLAALAVAAVATLPMAGAAFADPAGSAAPVPHTCPEFATRLDAQAALEAHAADADRLDPDHDGFACQARLGEPAVSEERATGDGGGAAMFAFVLGGIGAGVLGAGTLAKRGAARRRPVG